MLTKLADIVIRHSLKLVALAVLLAVVSLLLAWQRIGFDTNQDNLIAPEQPELMRYKGFLTEFGDWEYFYVVVRVPEGGADAARKFVSALADKARGRPDLFASVTDKIPLDALQDSLSLILPAEDFKDFTNALQTSPDTFSQFLSLKSTEEFYDFLATVLTKGSQTGGSRDNLEKIWPLLTDLIAAPFDKDALKRLSQRDLIHTLVKDRDPEGYLSSPDGRLLFLRLLPHKDYQKMTIVAEPLGFIRGEILALNRDPHRLEVGVTGRPVLQNDEATSTGLDSQLAGLGSLACVAGLFLVFFRSLRRSLMALFALAIGMAWTAGFIALAFPRMNLLTIAFAVILIGLGVEYSIHFLIRYQKERLSEKDAAVAIRATFKHAGQAILLGAVMASLAFFTAFFSDFLALQQLGIITGVGVILCSVSALTVFPALLAWRDISANLTGMGFVDFSFLSRLTKRPWALTVTFLFISVATLPAALKSRFEYNLLKLQDQRLESVQYERIIQEASGFSTWFLASTTPDLKDLEKKRAAFSKLPSVLKTASILDLIRPDQKERLKTLKGPAQKITAGRTPPQNPPGLSQSLLRLEQAFNALANQALSQGLSAEVAELSALGGRIKGYRVMKPNAPPHAIPAELARLQAFLKSLLLPRPLSEATLPAELVGMYKSPAGSYSLTIYPKQDIWEKPYLDRFIAEARGVDPLVTGAPITTWLAAQQMVSGFQLVGLLTCGLVLICLYWEFRGVGTTLLIFGNLLVSFVWLLAVMKLLDIQINLANFFALPVLIGTGIDNGIHIVHRYRETGNMRDVFGTTVPAVVLCCLTTIFGFGSLAFVRHQGLASFGMIMATGTFFSMISAVVFLPSLLLLRRPSRQEIIEGAHNSR